MKKIKKTVFAFLFCLSLSVSLATIGLCECSLKTGWEHYPPYQDRDSRGNLTGLDLDMVKKNPRIYRF